MNLERLVIVGGQADVLGGVERYCQRFLAAFEEHSGVEVRWLHANSAVLCAGPKWKALRRFRSTLRDLKRELESLSPEGTVVWVQHGNALDLWVLRAARGAFRGRVLCTTHVGRQWRHMRWPGLRRVTGRLLRRADRVLTLSEDQGAVLDRMRIQTRSRIPTLLPRWIQDKVASGDREGVLFVGRVAPEKGVADLVDAFASLPSTQPATLTIVGGADPVFEKELQQRIRRLGIGERVRFLGPQSEDEVAAAMRRARVFCYPSRADAFPLSILEAFAADLCVVAYDIPGTAEMLRDLGGHAVRPGDVDALGAALQAALEARPGDGAAQVRARYGWERVVRAYEAAARSGE